MKQKKTNKLDQQDEKAVSLFEELGMPKNLAKTLLYISQVEECRSSEIEHGANLRQPEVSVAMQELQKKGWITKNFLKKEGKGRPVHIYKLKSPITDIVNNFEQEKIHEIEAIQKDLTDLKSLIETI